MNANFCIHSITPALTARIYGKSYKKDACIDLCELSYLTVLHYNFHGAICNGELIVNHQIADKVLEIFKELFACCYPIETLCLVDDYNADDELSMAANNSSAFNYRTIAGTTTLSNHSKGLAIDINPLYNPYVKIIDGAVRILPIEGAPYVNRELDHPYYIRKGDACYHAFIRQGFTWGGEWIHSKDYQHFDIEL